MKWLTWIALLAFGCGDPQINQPPVAVAGPDLYKEYTGTATHIRLDGAQSFDPDGDAIQWRWRALRTPNTSLDELPTTPEPRIELTTPGVYTFELVVMDAQAHSEPDYVNVVLATPPP